MRCRAMWTGVLALTMLAAASRGAWGADPPSNVLDLSNWKLTLPIATRRAGRPDEIEPRELAGFHHPRYFFVNESGDGIVFRAHCGGSSTKGSDYPRCELREMLPDGSDEIGWGTQDGRVHRFTARLAVTATPAVKKHVVCAQIHDADDDLMMVRLEGKKLFIERNQSPEVELDQAYSLGRPFQLKVEARDGSVRVWYDEALKLDWKVKRSGCYFKIGCYTQSNVKKGDAAEAHGEVAVFALRVEHE